MSKLGLDIEKGARHCKITDEQGEVVFRTTNIRDAEHYVQLVEEVERLQRLLEARGMAPHRIYLLAADEDKRGRVNLENVPANEVVIVAKAEDGIVVRHLSDGREEIVDLDELEPIEGGSYLQASEINDESIHVVVRFDRESESASIATFRSKEKADAFGIDWTKSEEAPGSEYSSTLSFSEGDVLLYKTEASFED
jgi:hypothetical protein